MKTHHLVLLVLGSVGVALAQEPIPFSETDTLEDIRAKIELNRYNFTVATNRIFNMSPEEKAAFFSRRPRRSLGAILSPEEMGPLATRELMSLPSAFCWTNVGGHSYIGAIRDQGDCGSCYSFGACASAEGVYNYAMGLYDGACANFSESFIIWCLGRLSQYNDNFYGCEGADYEYQELQALTVEGVCTEAAFPYRETDPGSCTHWSDPRTVFAGWYRVPCNDINAIKAAIQTYGVVDAAVYVGSSFEAYSSGIYKDSKTTCPDDEYTESNHAIALVGWNDNGGDGYWILRNSWGTSWGEKGYMRISYQAARVGCAVAYLVYSNTVSPVTPPTVTTVAASLIATNAATLNGTVNPQGASSWYWFEYGVTTNYGFSSSKTSAGSGSAAVSVTNRVTGLTPGTTYHFRIVATNTGGKSEGLDRSFVTASSPAAAPSAITDPATEVTNTSSLLRGRVNPNGYATGYRFEYGLTTAYSHTTAVFSAGSGTALLSVSNRATGLTPGSTYHFRVVATNIGGRSNGIDRTFATVSSPATPAPWAITDPASHITNTAATMNGTVNPNGHATAWWFEYGLSDSYGLSTPAASAGSGASPITVTNRLTGLPSGATYHFRVVATNVGGRSNGVDRTFSTSSSGSPDAPWAITAPATQISNTEATVNGAVNPNGYATTWWFEYGLSESYGSTTPAASAGSGTSSITVTNRLTGLTSGKLYHFRVVATNLYGRSNGVDRTFATLTSNLAARVFWEDFEHGGSLPGDWTQTYETRTLDWVATSGSIFNNPSSAHGGSYNALFAVDSYNSHVTRLITPAIDFGAATNQATLSFWHYMRDWYGDQDELRIYYRTSAGGSWNLLAEYTSRVRAWTKRVLSLPNPGSTYYIAFEGTAQYGYGVCVDDVEVYAYTWPRSPDFEPAALSLPSASKWVLSWESVSDRYYAVQSSTNLSLGFSTVISNLVATPPMNTYTSGAAGQWRFYRIDERLPY